MPVRVGRSRFVPAPTGGGGGGGGGTGETTVRAYAADTLPTDAASDGSPYSMGLEFYATQTAYLTEIRFWQPTGNEPSFDTRSGALWRVDSAATGTNLSGTAAFPATAPGWNTLALSPPQLLTPNQRYRAVVLHPTGRYTAEPNYYSSGPGAADLTTGPLVVPNATNTTGNDQNAFNAASGMAFPGDSFNAARYGIDVTVTAVTHGSQLTSSNTGVQSGVTLTTQSTSGGTIPAGNYVNKSFPDPSPDGSYTVSGNSTTFTNCSFVGGLLMDSANDCTFTNCDIDGGLSISSSHRATFTRCRVYNGSDLVHITGDQPGVSTTCDDITFIETLIHQPGNLGVGDHCDGIQTRGLQRFVFRRSAVNMGPQFDNAGDTTPLNASLFFENANGGTDTITVVDSYLNGGGQVYFIQPTTGTKIVTGNRWGPDFTFTRVRNDSGVTYTDWSDNRVLADNTLLSP